MSNRKKNFVVSDDGWVTKTSTSKGKTIMCKFYVKGVENSCIHGESCTFAHGFENLSVQSCKYNQDCNRITKDDEGNIINKCRNICRYIHVGETTKQHIERITSSFDEDTKIYDLLTVTSPKASEGEVKKQRSKSFGSEKDVSSEDSEYITIVGDKTSVIENFKEMIDGGYRKFRISILD